DDRLDVCGGVCPFDDTARQVRLVEALVTLGYLTPSACLLCRSADKLVEVGYHGFLTDELAPRVRRRDGRPQHRRHGVETIQHRLVVLSGLMKTIHLVSGASRQVRSVWLLEERTLKRPPGAPGDVEARRECLRVGVIT